MNRQFQKLLNKVNKVTAYHRHGNPVPTKVLDDLANAQLECEEAIRRNEFFKLRDKRLK